MPRIWLFVTLCFYAAFAQAGVYQCKTAQGKVEYRDTPCQHGIQRLYQKDKTGPQSKTRVTRSQQFKPLVGQWCNFATSLSLTGAKDLSKPAQWTFGDRQLEVVNGPLQILSDFSQEEELLQVDDPRLGNYHLVMQGADGMVMKGDYGYYFFRRGHCAP
ncbi:DUF4124 domain-containing protein [Gallaecimonas kandeliae]|uniref:DUF4124 domain-containing protein n=1 Tax=Gallaecimonas kandeliae TaxID=3029055 RepID=UPI002647969C|nr:DUF4124 domain-containing protein [Gallaecimonas kandeliae]WKE65550.1 DUF4124 domain-containing protein [Gallaecimonas kandeliae]